MRVFLQQSRSIRRFRNGNSSLFRTTYFRILAIASIDVLLTLPIGIANMALAIASFRNLEHTLTIPFYQGWAAIHQHFQIPVKILYATLEEHGSYTLAQVYFNYWTTPLLAFSIFGLFGLTNEARTSYQYIFNVLHGRVGWRPQILGRKREESDLDSVEFDIPPREMTLDSETG